jgi:hypothetical protein
MKTTVLVLVCALALAGCKSEAEKASEENKRLQEQAEAAAATAKRDDEACRSYGFEVGMQAYFDCRMKLVSLRLQAASLFVQATRPPIVIEQPRGPTMTRCQTNGGVTDCRSY